MHTRRSGAARASGRITLRDQRRRRLAMWSMLSVYIDMPGIGLTAFAPVTPARGSLFSARRRLGMREGRQPPPGIAEEVLYQW